MTIALVPEATKNFIEGATLFIVGSAFWLSYLNVRDGLANHAEWWRFAFAAVIVGVSICMGLIAELIFHVPTVPYTWRVGLYITGLSLASAGLIGLMVYRKRHAGRGFPSP